MEWNGNICRSYTRMELAAMEEREREIFEWVFMGNITPIKLVFLAENYTT